MTWISFSNNNNFYINLYNKNNNYLREEYNFELLNVKMVEYETNENKNGRFLNIAFVFKLFFLKFFLEYIYNNY